MPAGWRKEGDRNRLYVGLKLKYTPESPKFETRATRLFALARRRILDGFPGMKPSITLARGRTPDGAELALVRHDTQHFLMIGGRPLMSTTSCASEQQMADVACAGLPPGARVLIGGLGFGFTLRRVLEMIPRDGVAEVAELLPVIADWNREFLRGVNGGLLDDPRVSLRLCDVFSLLGQGGENRYHAILLDVDNSPDPLVQKGNARLYQHTGLARIRESLHPGGRVVFWSAHRDPAFVKALRQVFTNVESIGAKSHPGAKKFSHTLFVAARD